MEWQTIAAIVVFIAVFIALSTNLINQTVVALAGAAVFLLLQLASSKNVFETIDWEVIFLLVSMMVIVSITQKTGLFQWVAIKMAKAMNGNPVSILIGITIITALFSAFLDNVTTVMILVPISILIAVELGVSPVPFVVLQSLASNIGGTATIIGDPPNTMIGIAANLSFLDFIVNLAPVVSVLMVIISILIFFVFGPQMKVSNERRSRIMDMDENSAVKDWGYLFRSLVILLAVVVTFSLNSLIHIPLFLVAFSGAVLMLFFEGKDVIHHRLMEIEWESIFFFIGLFIMVGGLVQLGIIKFLSDWVIHLTEGNIPFASQILLWFSGFLSAVINNIPYVATMIPMVQQIQGGLLNPATANPLWWSLALGACLGGNMTIIGASANVVATGLAKKSGINISFFKFFKYGFGLTLLTLLISSLYVAIILVPRYQG